MGHQTCVTSRSLADEVTSPLTLRQGHMNAFKVSNHERKGRARRSARAVSTGEFAAESLPYALRGTISLLTRSSRRDEKKSPFKKGQHGAIELGRRHVRWQTHSQRQGDQQTRPSFHSPSIQPLAKRLTALSRHATASICDSILTVATDTKTTSIPPNIHGPDLTKNKPFIFIPNLILQSSPKSQNIESANIHRLRMTF